MKTASTLARMQPTTKMEEVAKEQVLEQLNDAYKQMIISAATRKMELLKMVGGQQKCGDRGAYCNTDKDCCPGRTCREDDDQDYFTGYFTCV